MEGDQPQKSGEVRSMLVAREGAVVRKYSKTLYWFQFMSSVPIVGPLLFSLLIGFTSPYSGTSSCCYSCCCCCCCLGLGRKI